MRLWMAAMELDDFSCNLLNNKDLTAVQYLPSMLYEKFVKFVKEDTFALAIS